jgi:hypothetical protein
LLLVVDEVSAQKVEQELEAIRFEASAAACQQGLETPLDYDLVSSPYQSVPECAEEERSKFRRHVLRAIRLMKSMMDVEEV